VTVLNICKQYAALAPVVCLPCRAMVILAVQLEVCKPPLAIRTSTVLLEAESPSPTSSHLSEAAPIAPMICRVPMQEHHIRPSYLFVQRMTQINPTRWRPPNTSSQPLTIIQQPRHISAAKVKSQTSRTGTDALRKGERHRHQDSSSSDRARWLISP
jgi:hypothetical protein